MVYKNKHEKEQGKVESQEQITTKIMNKIKYNLEFKVTTKYLYYFTKF